MFAVKCQAALDLVWLPRCQYGKHNPVMYTHLHTFDLMVQSKHEAEMQPAGFAETLGVRRIKLLQDQMSCKSSLVTTNVNGMAVKHENIL